MSASDTALRRKRIWNEPIDCESSRTAIAISENEDSAPTIHSAPRNGAGSRRGTSPVTPPPSLITHHSSLPLVLLHPRFPDDAPGLFDLTLHLVAELLRRARDDAVAGLDELSVHVGEADDAHHLAVQHLYGRRRGFRRREQRVPLLVLVAGQPVLGDGRHVG